MKKMMIMIASLMVSAAFAQAPKHAPHGNPSPEKKAKHLTEKMKMALNLSADQEKKVYEINFNAAKSMMILKSDTLLEKKAKHERKKAINQTRIEELKKVLTPEQVVKAKEIIEEKKEQMKGKGKMQKHEKNENEKE